MKRTLAYLLLLSFVLGIAGVAFARTLDEEKAAVRAYLKVIDAKIIKARNAKQTAKVKLLQGQKAATLARWNKLQASMIVPPPPPPPPPMAPMPKPVPMVAPAPTGLFGMGLNTDVSLGYIAGNSVMAGRADIILGDMLGLGPMVGLSEKAVNWKLGLGYAQGKDINDIEKKAITLIVDGVLNLPADLLGGVESYIGGGINYDVYGSEKKAGSIGVQAYAGIQGDLGLGGKSFVEVGYSVIRSGKDNVTVPYSMKGVAINVGQQILL
jgi:hypothetical protein